MKWVEVQVPYQRFKFEITDEEYAEYELLTLEEFDNACDFYLSEVNPNMAVSLEENDEIQD